MPRGSDKSWAQKMYNVLLEKQAPFGKPKLSNTAFIVRHFGEKVQFKTITFCINFDKKCYMESNQSPAVFG